VTAALTDVDPWLCLDQLETPTAADRRARELLGTVATEDPRRVAGLVSWLVRRSGLDGSTVLPVDVVAPALRAYDVDDPTAGADLALRQGRVAAFPEDRVLGHPVLAPAEDRVADALVELVVGGSVASGRDLSAADLVGRVVASSLTVAVMPRGQGRLGLVRAVEAATADQGARVAHAGAGEVASQLGVLEAAETVVVDGAERLPLDDAAWLLERLAGGGLARLVLLGDPDELDGASPGRFLGDVVESGAVPVCTGSDVSLTEPSAVLGSAVRSGRLPDLDPAERAVVVTPAADPAQAISRASQLVTTSVPRVFGVEPAATRVATLRTGGDCGVAALRNALEDAAPFVQVGTLDTVSGGFCEALVLVLPAESAGSLTRAHLLSAAACAARHLSIVHQAGPALADAVARVPRTRRRTRLATILRDTLG